MASSKSYFVIVPVFNEEKNIKSFIYNLKKYTKKIIVVNDGSKDNTKSIIENIPGIKVLNLTQQSGKGTAMKAGAKLAWKMKADGIIFMDGDNQHHPKYLPQFFDHLKKGEDIILGIRILKAEVPMTRKWGNQLLLNVVRVLYNIYLEDLICGYRGFSKKGYKNVLWKSSGYGVETEVVTLIGRKNLEFNKIIVDTIYLDKYKGFSIKEGLKILLKLPYWRFRKL